MNIVVVDHVFLEKEHVKRLEGLGSLKVYREPPETPDELKRRIGSAEIVVVGWSHLTNEVMDSAKNLKMISIWATTCHYADLDIAKERGIVVTHVPGYATEAVAEHTFTLLLAAVRKLVSADSHVRNGQFDWRPFEGHELAGKTLGLIGTGAIGLRVAELAKAFGMHVLGFDKYPNMKRANEIGMEYVNLETLLKKSDIVSLHVALTPETKDLLSGKEIATMKDGAVIVNTSQGKVINEEALVEALKSGKIASAGLDVLAEEPPSKDNPLFRLDNVVLSPHIGFHTIEAVRRCTDICVENVAKFVEGRMQNVC